MFSWSLYGFLWREMEQIYLKWQLVLFLDPEQHDEKKKVKQAAECCRQILNFVNQAVKEAENKQVSVWGEDSMHEPLPCHTDTLVWVGKTRHWSLPLKHGRFCVWTFAQYVHPFLYSCTIYMKSSRYQSHILFKVYFFGWKWILWKAQIVHCCRMSPAASSLFIATICYDCISISPWFSLTGINIHSDKLRDWKEK